MARRKGEISQSARERPYPFVARWILDRRLQSARAAAEMEVAAISISGGDYLTRSPRGVENAYDLLFKTAAQAHAMQVWFEAHVRPYDPFDDHVYSAENARRTVAAIHDMIAGAAATGALRRVYLAYRDGGPQAAVDELREIEPGFHQMDGQRAAMLLIENIQNTYGEWLRSRRGKR
jgi:hypothetical protein